MPPLQILVGFYRAIHVFRGFLAGPAFEAI
jgi:hypothetical protein